MKILSVSLKNFRNIEEININPCDSMNVICGENAQGKTNLIEALWLFTGAKSFRGAKDDAFVKFSKEKAEIKISFVSQGVEKDASIIIDEKRNAFLNGKKLKSPSLLAGNFNAIVFSPIDLRIVSDGPNLRRRFLDTAIGQLYPSYIEILRAYNRAVIQRNKIIKDFKYDSTLSVMLDVFEKEISSNGIKIIKYRKRYLQILSEFYPDLYKGLSSGKENLEIVYKESVDTDNFEDELKKKRTEDMYTATTSVGPHRDDIEFLINGISARAFGSQGQKRSVALSLKLAEAKVIEKDVGECPICLLDDVMSELDPKRQDFILNHIKEMQTFLTCCDPDNVKNLKAGKKFTLEKGGIL